MEITRNMDNNLTPQHILECVDKIRQKANVRSSKKIILAFALSMISMLSLLLIHLGVMHSDNMYSHDFDSGDEARRYMSEYITYATATKRALTEANSISSKIKIFLAKQDEKHQKTMTTEEIIKPEFTGQISYKSSQNYDSISQCSTGTNISGSISNSYYDSVYIYFSRPIFNSQGTAIESCTGSTELYRLNVSARRIEYRGGNSEDILRAELINDLELRSIISSKIISELTRLDADLTVFLKQSEKINIDIDDRIKIIQKRMAGGDVKYIVYIGTRSIITLTLIAILTASMRLITREFQEISRRDRSELFTALIVHRVINLSPRDTGAIRSLINDDPRGKDNDASLNSLLEQALRKVPKFNIPRHKKYKARSGAQPKRSEDGSDG